MLPRHGNDDSEGPAFVRRYVPAAEPPAQTPEETTSEDPEDQQAWAPHPPEQPLPQPPPPPRFPAGAGETGGGQPGWFWQAQVEEGIAGGQRGFPTPPSERPSANPFERPFGRQEPLSAAMRGPEMQGPPPPFPEKGRHERSRGTRRRSRQRTPLLVAGAVAFAVILAAVGAWRLLGAESCGSNLGLNVAADPAVASAVTVMAQRFNDEDHKVGGRCVKISANAVPSSGIAFALGGDMKPGEAQADAYIPDSSFWLAVAGREAQRTDARLPHPDGSVAASPVVFALPKTAPFANRRVSWTDLMPKQAGAASPYSLHIVDPTSDATGMAALLMARQAAGNGKNAIANFTGILQSIQSGGAQAVAGDVESAFAAFGNTPSPVPLLVTSEQSVWRHARGGGTPVKALIPTGSTISLDFPYITTGSGDKAKASSMFLTSLRSSAGAAEMYRVGLRTAGGVADPSVTSETGLGRTVIPIPATQQGAVIEVLELWRRLRLGTRMLTLVDVSGSMLEGVAGTGQTRMQVTAGEVAKGMAFLPDDAEAGLWSFSTDLNGALPYKELVPLAPMSQPDNAGTHRATLQEKLGQLRAKPLGGTGLYDSVLAAFRKVKTGYEDDKLNIVLVLTDGRNDNKKGISRATLLADLKKEYDPQHPVEVIGLGFGPGVDLGDLQTIAKATGGAAYQISRHEQIRQLFQRSAALKVCDNPQQCITG